MKASNKYLFDQVPHCKDCKFIYGRPGISCCTLNAHPDIAKYGSIGPEYRYYTIDACRNPKHLHPRYVNQIEFYCGPLGIYYEPKSNK